MSNLLIDVRSPREYATGFLDEAVNIEYTRIGEDGLLLSTLQQQQQQQERGQDDYGKDLVTLETPITLYCRSGRRSALALQTLRALGYRNVRDLGDLESAARVLRAEKGEKEKEKKVVEKNSSTISATNPDATLLDSYEALLAGLQETTRSEGP